jgi:HAD superfamily hydrolase (TIGR01490 family)
MPVTFFDVDHTLVKGSTAFHCAPVLRREKVLNNRLMIRIAWAHLRHHLGLLDFEKVYAEGVLPFVGMAIEDAEPVLRECWEKHVRPRLYREALDTIVTRREAGDRVVLLSASTWYLLRMFSEAMPIDDVIAFRQHVRDGILINDYDRPVCYGPNKLILARTWCKNHGESLDNATFYTDSSSDLALLRVVGNPRPVNPDPRLRWEARCQGWPVLRFRETIGTV